MSHTKDPLNAFNFTTPYRNSVSLMKALLERMRIPHDTSDRSQLAQIIKLEHSRLNALSPNALTRTYTTRFGPPDTSDTDILRERLIGKCAAPVIPSGGNISTSSKAEASDGDEEDQDDEKHRGQSISR
eukprot:975545_1